jgi:hypothetical protein
VSDTLDPAPDFEIPPTAGPLVDGCLSITHAAWDIDAVHGMHATYSVSKLGIARRLETYDSASEGNLRLSGWAQRAALAVGPEHGSGRRCRVQGRER